MITRTFEQIKATILEKGYKFFEVGDYNLNIIVVRENDVFENTFSDTLYLIFKIAGIWQVKTFKFTTLAGTKGFGGEQKPLTKWQTGTTNDGVAIIKEGQYLGAFEYTHTPYGRFPFTEYLKQVVAFTYYRDNDKDGFVSRNAPQETRNNSTHFHVMSNGADTEFVNTDNIPFSQGCVGATYPVFFGINGIMPIIRKAVALWGKKFTFTLMHAQDFNEKSDKK